VALTLKSWGNGTLSITPVNCVGDNLLYGTASDTLVTLALADAMPPP